MTAVASGGCSLYFADMGCTAGGAAAVVGKATEQIDGVNPCRKGAKNAFREGVESSYK